MVKVETRVGPRTLDVDITGGLAGKVLAGTGLGTRDGWSGGWRKVLPGYSNMTVLL